MLYRDFRKTGWRVSAIGQECWNIGNQWGQISDTEAEAIIKAACDGGMNLFDVAESYGVPNGLCEMRLGKALKGVRRPQSRRAHPRIRDQARQRRPAGQSHDHQRMTRRLGPRRPPFPERSTQTCPIDPSR